MHLIPLLLVLIIVVWLYRTQPKRAIILASIFAVFLLVILLFTQQDLFQPKSQPVLSDVEIIDLQMQATYASDYRLSAKIHNRSAVASIDAIVLRVYLQQCPAASKENCTVLIESIESIYRDIPPLQTLNVAETINFDLFHMTEQAQWQFEVLEVKGH